MIAIVSSIELERNAFATLCDGKGWTVVGCSSIRELARAIHHTTFKVIVARHRIGDDFVDDLIRKLREIRALPLTKLIVLMSADAPPSAEARQIALGVDWVHRDPVRSEVLLAYVEKYLHASRNEPKPPTAHTLQFSHCILRVQDRTLQNSETSIVLSPREALLLELLIHAGGDVVSYQTLYTEILGRQFRGDTSNMRVLLAKLSSSTRKVGLSLRHCIDVIPKTGYRYRSDLAESSAGDCPIGHSDIVGDVTKK